MGFLEQFLGRTPPDVEPVDLREGEVEVYRTAGCVMKGSVCWVGGDIVVTTQRLVLAPININDLVKLTSLGLKVVKVPHAGNVMTVIGWAQKVITQVDADYSAIRSVSIGQRTASLLRPPSLIVERTPAAPIEFGVLASRVTPNMSRKNEAARDRLLAAISQSLGV